MDGGGIGACAWLIVVCWLIGGEEHLRRRRLGAETAILARRGDGERRGCRRGAVRVLHSHCAESACERMHVHVKRMEVHCRTHDVPSASEPATELLPLQL